jgi:hypothetical protein
MRRLLALIGAVLVWGPVRPAHAQEPALTFGAAVKLTGADGSTEPRAAVDLASGRRYVITNAGDDAVVYVNTGGSVWRKTLGTIPDQRSATIDTEIVVTPTGRIVANELDFAGVTFKTGYSDDGGDTWHASSGMVPADTDRNWMAVGPRDPVSGVAPVYLAWHNLASGLVSHNIFVQTSTDNGASFGPPVPVTLPGSQAWLDLQCADAGAGSGIAVNTTTGRLYVSFSTRTAPVAGGCGAAVFERPSINIVWATRTWVSTSPDNAPGSWRSELALDRTDRLVQMGFNPPAVDAAGNVYIAFSESISKDDFRARIGYVHAPDDIRGWSDPVYVTDVGEGHREPVIAAGAAGRIDIAYLEAVPASPAPKWNVRFAQTLDSFAPSPVFAYATLSPSTKPAYQGTANHAEADCAAPGDPARGIRAGLLCSRAPDNFGMAIDASGFATVTWGSENVPDTGTFVSTQTGGTAIIP